MTVRYPARRGDHKVIGDVTRHGAVGDGTTDDTTSIQAAINEAVKAGGGSVYLPSPKVSYLVSSPLTVTLSGSSDHERIWIYGDGWKSFIKSTVVGDSTFKITNGQAVTIARLRLVGNDLTGASGNGHAIGFFDTAAQSGTFYPAQCDVRDVRIEDFRGDDLETTTTTEGVATTAAGIYIGPGLGNYIDRCSIQDCGIGILLDECYNTHVSRTLINGCDQDGIEIDSVGDGCSITKCDILSCGLDGNGDPTVVSGDVNYAGIRAVGNTSNMDPVIIRDNKFKTGQAIQVNALNAVAIRDNYIRVDPGNTASNTWGIKALSFDKIEVSGNTFEYLIDAGNTNTRHGMLLDMNANHPANIIVRDNQFNHSADVGYDCKVLGASTGSSDIDLDIQGNKFGSPRNGSTLSTVTDCINIDVCNYSGTIANNTFTVLGDGVSAGGTITDCLDVSGATRNNISIYGNVSRVYLTGGTITNPIEDYQDDDAGTFANSDATPDVTWKTRWHTGTVADTITDFDGIPPQGFITVVSEAAITYDVTGTSLAGGTTDIVTAAGDVTSWTLDTDGTTWRLVGFMDQSVDNSAGA